MLPVLLLLLLLPHRQSQPRCLLQRREQWTEALAPRPAGLGDLPRQPFRRLRIGRGDHHGQAVEWRVGVGEATHHRHVQHPPRIRRFAHALLAEIDQLAVRPVRCILTGELGHGRRHDRQPDAGEAGACAGQQAAQHLRRLGAAFAHVEMRVGAVADERVHQCNVGVRDIGMQIVGGDHGDRVVHHPADQGEQGAFRVVVLCRQPGAMQHAIHAVELSPGAQTGLPLRHQAVEERLINRSVGFRHGEHDRHWVPRPGGVHGGDEARQFAQHARGRRARLIQHRLTRQQGAGGKIGLGGDRRKAVALDREAEQGDAWFQLSSPAFGARGWVTPTFLSRAWRERVG